MNAPANVVFPGHSTLAWSLAVSSFAVGGPFGALVGGRMADSRGRRGALLLDTWLFLFGGILQTCAPDMMTIIVARFIIGFASGFSTVVVPVLLGECCTHFDEHSLSPRICSSMYNVPETFCGVVNS